MVVKPVNPLCEKQGLAMLLGKNAIMGEKAYMYGTLTPAR